MCSGSFCSGSGDLCVHRRRLQPDAVVANDSDHLSALYEITFPDPQLHEGSRDSRPRVGLIPRRVRSGYWAQIVNDFGLDDEPFPVR